MLFEPPISTPKYLALSKIWQRTDQAFLKTQVVEDEVPEEKQVAAARAVLAVEAEIYGYERHYLKRLYAFLNQPVTPGDIMGVTRASLYADTVRQATLGLAVRGDLHADEIKALQKATEALSKTNDIYSVRDSRVTACNDARAVIRDLGI